MLTLTEWASIVPIQEKAWEKNIGFEEMMMFYRHATDEEITEMENIVEAEDLEGFKALIKRVIGVELK